MLMGVSCKEKKQKASYNFQEPWKDKTKLPTDRNQDLRKNHNLRFEALTVEKPVAVVFWRHVVIYYQHFRNVMPHFQAAFLNSDTEENVLQED